MPDEMGKPVMAVREEPWATDVDAPPRAYRFDGFTLDLDRGALLTSMGTELPLRPKSFALLRLFVENAGRLLDRDAIMRTVWPGVFVTDDSITQCVRDIRLALGDGARDLLRTVSRRGYLFSVAVSRAHPATLSVRPANGTDRVGCDDVTGLLVGHAGNPQGAAPSPASPSANDAEGASARGPLALRRAGSVEPSLAAERRHVTVLFCDLVGSAGLAEQLDPEDLGSVVGVFLELCAATIARHAGHVAFHGGDGVLAFFGYPFAGEDAAERSVRAGLAIVEAAGAARPARSLGPEVRIGIATGVMIMDGTPESTSGRGGVGMPLDLAARLQEIAEPGTVTIADSTRCLVGSLFALEDLGRRCLRGFTRPVRAWRVTGDGMAESRFEALRGSSLAPMVGRRQELELLLDRWDQAREGEGQVVLLAGEAGIGKSRLVRAVRDGLAGSPHAYQGCYCSPHHEDSPLWPVIAQLERSAGFARGEAPAAKLAKLERLLGRPDEDVDQLVLAIASLLSIPGDGRRPSTVNRPQAQRERTLAALADQLAGLAAQRPVLLIWEDVQWADPTSLELLGSLIDRSQSLRVLALITCRPEFAPPWPGHTHVTRLTLNRLSRRRSGRLIGGLTGGKPLPAAVADHIAGKAEGMPLFVEELTKAVLESDLLREAHDRFELQGPLSSLTVPATLQDSLMARLDRLAPGKETAQVAAVIGREFSRELLTAVILLEGEDLAEALRQLIAAELVLCRGSASDPIYAFRHALIRDAAYASLPKNNRKQLHARVAEALEVRSGQAVEAEPEILAHHWTEAGEAEKAAAYRLKAGERALARSATAEAVAQLKMGYDVLQGLPEDDERRRRELDLQVALGAALSAAKGQAAPETTQAYSRASELCASLGDERRLVSVLMGLWGSHNARDELGAARKVGGELLRLAKQEGDAAASILGHRALGVTLFGLGEFASARAHLQQLVAIGSPAVRQAPVPLPYDPRASGQAWLSLTLSVLGHPEQALAHANEALAEARGLRHHNTLCLVLCLRCSLGQFARDHHDVAKHADALLVIALEQGFAYWAGLGMFFQGWARAMDGDGVAGIEQMRRALAACQTTGTQAYVPYNLALLADTCRRAHDVAQARELLDEAFDRLERTDARYCEAELLCIDGGIRLAEPRPDRDGAEASFLGAIKVARRQRAKAVELRAAMDLARSWADVGKRRQAHDLVTPVYAWFTEGHDTRPLVEAKRLIESTA